MNFDIVGIGQAKKPYRKFKDSEFETLSSYIEQAKKIIVHYSNARRNSQLRNQLMNSDDAISNVANALMLADWTYDSDHESKNGNEQKCTQRTYRFLRATWAIKSYLTRKQRHLRKGNVSLDRHINNEEVDFYDLLPDGSPNPDSRSMSNELKELLEDIINSGILTPKQACYITAHYIKNMTLSEIAEDAGVTRQAVYDGVRRGVAILKIEFGTE